MKTIYDELQMANMDEMIVSTDEKPIVGTWALATCHGILMYDPKTKQAILGHVGGKSIPFLKDMISLIDPNHSDILEYLIVPGNYRVSMNDYSIKEKMEKYLNKYDHNGICFVPMDIDYKDVITIEKQLESSEFAFDSRTGRFVTKKIDFTYENLSNHIKR